MSFYHNVLDNFLGDDLRLPFGPTIHLREFTGIVSCAECERLLFHHDHMDGDGQMSINDAMPSSSADAAPTATALSEAANLAAQFGDKRLYPSRVSVFAALDDHFTGYRDDTLAAMRDVFPDEWATMVYDSLAELAGSPPGHLLATGIRSRAALARETANALDDMLSETPDASLGLMRARFFGTINDDGPVLDLRDVRQLSDVLEEFCVGAIAVTRIGLFPNIARGDDFVFVLEVTVAVVTACKAQAHEYVEELNRVLSHPVVPDDDFSLTWLDTDDQATAAAAAIMFSIEDPAAMLSDRYAQQHNLSAWHELRKKRHFYRFFTLSWCPLGMLMFGAGTGQAKAHALITTARHHVKQRAYASPDGYYCDDNYYLLFETAALVAKWPWASPSMGINRHSARWSRPSIHAVSYGTSPRRERVVRLEKLGSDWVLRSSFA